MPNVSESLIQEILDMKKSSTKTAAKKASSKLDILSETLLKMAEELEEEKEESSEEDEEKEEEEKEEKDSESGSEAEDVVEAALAELDKTKEAKAGVSKVSKIDYTKLAQEILKVAVDGTSPSLGLDGDMTAASKADGGEVARAAQADAAKNTTVNPSVSEKEMGSQAGTDPMAGVAPQSKGGDETPLTPGEIKSAMAKMTDEDAAMLFKLAQVGYDVTVDVLSDEIVEKQAMAKVMEKAERVKAAQAYNYLRSLGIDPLR